MMKQLDPTTAAHVTSWLEGNYDEETKSEIRRLLQEDTKALTDAFYKTLAFGTGGMRGIMGVGCNRINIYTIRAATQGLANYLQGQGSVLISYDSRNNSKLFAEEAAKVLVGNGIEVHLFRELRPTPLVSFGCRHLGCSAAIMVTASHNPPEYNGYKVYWSDGGQVLPPHDRGIVEEVGKITKLSQVKMGSLDVHWVGEELDTAYVEAIRDLQSCPEQNQKHGNELRVVYTPLHGTGATLTPKALTSWGFTNVEMVDAQCVCDGNFPTVAKPNPEEKEALTLGIEQMEASGADLLIATDPDADRVGIAVQHNGKTVLLNGNEVACLALHHLCTKRSGTFGCVKTIVTSELFRAIAEKHGWPCFDVLTGFKYIGQMMENWTDPSPFLFGAEESYGYLLGTHARDKDAVVCAALICEMALDAKLAGKTLVDQLAELHATYGTCKEGLASIEFHGKEGAERMEQLMKELRQTPPKEFAGVPVKRVEDYATSTKTDLKTGHSAPIELPQSNVLLYWLEDGSKLVIRPSGTEPKIKLYGGVVCKTGAQDHLKALLDALSLRLGQQQ